MVVGEKLNTSSASEAQSALASPPIEQSLEVAMGLCESSIVEYRQVSNELCRVTHYVNYSRRLLAFPLCPARVRVPIGLVPSRRGRTAPRSQPRENPRPRDRRERERERDRHIALLTFRGLRFVWSLRAPCVIEPFFSRHSCLAW